MTPWMLPELDELREPRNRADNFADGVLSGFFACVADDFARDGLHLPHVETSSHHPSARAHDATHAERTAGIARIRSLMNTLRSRKLVHQNLHLVARVFPDQQ